jgi:hypothetical protein
MAFNLAKEHFNAKKVVGLIQVNGSKAKWMLLVCVSGRMELTLEANGVTALKKVKVH